MRDAVNNEVKVMTNDVALRATRFGVWQSSWLSWLKAFLRLTDFARNVAAHSFTHLVISFCTGSFCVTGHASTVGCRTNQCMKSSAH